MRDIDSLTYPDLEDGREDPAVFSIQPDPDTIPTSVRNNPAIPSLVVPSSQIYSKRLP